MGRYAAQTGISVAKSKAQIEEMVTTYGAEQFGIVSSRDRAVVAFLLNSVSIRISLELPCEDSNEFKLTPARGFVRTAEDAHRAWEQACRQLWRALWLIIRAKLEAVDSGITTIEREFFADLLLPGGKTIGEQVLPELEHVRATGELPKLLPAMGA